VAIRKLPWPTREATLASVLLFEMELMYSPAELQPHQPRGRLLRTAEEEMLHVGVGQVGHRKLRAFEQPDRGLLRGTGMDRLGTHQAALVPRRAGFRSLRAGSQAVAHAPALPAQQFSVR